MMLSAETLHGRPWRLIAGANTIVAAQLRFISDGCIWGHPSPLEARWGLHDAGLSLLAADGSETARFTELRHDEAGEPQLDGIFLRTPDLGLTYHLRPAHPPSPRRQTATLHSAVSLGGPSKILFVSFGSLKRGFVDNEARWEFYDLPLTLGLDHVRITESWSPDFMWYVDKTSRIRALLGAILATGYRMVIMCGISSGGYASLLMSELMCQEFPDVAFRSFTINPQTTHNESVRAELRSLMPAYIPALIRDEALALRDTPQTDIATIAHGATFRGNVQHHLFYDSGNPAELIYASQLDGLAGIHHHRHHFAVGHLSGCIALFEREVVHDAIRALVSTAGDHA
jgi:hypothetical protein